MRHIFIVLVAIFLMATSAYATVETAEHGPQEITTCWIKAAGTHDYPTLAPGGVVILNTSATYLIGKSVTGSTTEGQDIYGVYCGTVTVTAVQMSAGRYIPVLVRGYWPTLNLQSADIGAGVGLFTSDTPFCADSGASTTGITGHTITMNDPVAGAAHCRAFLK